MRTKCNHNKASDACHESMLTGKCSVCVHMDMCFLTYWKRFCSPAPSSKNPHSNPNHLSLKIERQDHSMLSELQLLFGVFLPSLSWFSNKHLCVCCPSFLSSKKILSCCDGCKRCDNWQAAAVLKLVFVVLTGFLAVSL